MDDRVILVRFSVREPNFLFSKASRRALEPTQPLIRYWGAFCRLGHDADRALQSNYEFKNYVELYLQTRLLLVMNRGHNYLFILILFFYPLFLTLFRVSYMSVHVIHIVKSKSRDKISRPSKYSGSQLPDSLKSSELKNFLR